MLQSKCMKRKLEQEVKCPGCERVDRKYHAKGLCKACYIREYRKDVKKKAKKASK